MPVSELLLLSFARANPVFFRDTLDELTCESPRWRRDLAQRVLRLTSRPGFLVHGGDNGPAARALAELYPCGGRVQTTAIRHVFPVWCPELSTALMIPMSIEPAADWHVSDAFGKFGVSTAGGEDSLTVLMKLLERHWAGLHDGEQLPLRWRLSLRLQVLCPVHLEAIGGESLHLPLIVALLRGLTGNLETGDAAPAFPFGDCPVFATGRLGRDNTSFWKVNFVAEKLAGFIREYGEGLPALLQTGQLAALHDTGLLDRVRWYRVDSIPDLLSLPELAGPLRTFAGPVHPTEVDGLLQVMSSYHRTIRFSDVAALSGWMLSQIDSPVYRFQLHRHTGFVHMHQGRFMEASRHFTVCGDLLHRHDGLFGLSDQCDHAVAMAVLACDLADPASVAHRLDEVESQVDLLPAFRRVAFWGTRCQLSRLEGDYARSIRAGEEAVRLADQSRAGDSGQDRNYLIHALIARARNGASPGSSADLARALELCREASETWAPRNSTGKLRSHLAYCLHYQAEIARLSGQPFTLPLQPPWRGSWGDGWLFALLSCARNSCHETVVRQDFARRLVAAASRKIDGQPVEGLFFMLLQVYRIYMASLCGTAHDEPLEALRSWCAHHAESGFPGWQARLAPAFLSLGRQEPGATDLLCDLVPYH